MVTSASRSSWSKVQAERHIRADRLGGELPPDELYGDGVGETEPAVADDLDTIAPGPWERRLACLRPALPGHFLVTSTRTIALRRRGVPVAGLPHRCELACVPAGRARRRRRGYDVVTDARG
jgi:hypothetical protein